MYLSLAQVSLSLFVFEVHYVRYGWYKTNHKIIMFKTDGGFKFTKIQYFNYNHILNRLFYVWIQHHPQSSLI